MARLVRNTHVARHGWWGPAHGRVDPPPEVAELITNPACWDTSPGDEVHSGTEDPAVSTGAAGSGDDGGASTTPPEPGPNSSTIELDSLDRDALLALAGEREVDVDRRWGEARLRQALAAAEAG